MTTDDTTERYAVYRFAPEDIENRFWLIDTGVGGVWSPNVDNAEWFPSVDAAIDTLYACDLVEPGANWSEHGFLILRMR